jgi:hypothetical protein
MYQVSMYMLNYSKPCSIRRYTNDSNVQICRKSTIRGSEVLSALSEAGGWLRGDPPFIVCLQTFITLP